MASSDLPKSIYVLEQACASVQGTGDKNLKGCFVVSKFSMCKNKDYNGYAYDGLAIEQVFDTTNEAKLACTIHCGADLLRTIDIAHVPNLIPFAEYSNGGLKVV